MSDQDFMGLIIAMEVLISAISLSITAISLTGYWKVRNRRLLLLAFAFLLLSLEPLLASLHSIGLYSIPLADMNDAMYWEVVLSSISLVAFAVLSYLYLKERKTQSIKISQNQWIVGGVLILIEICFACYISFTYIGQSNSNYGMFQEWQLLNFLMVLIESISYVLIILIVISLFSYYRAKNTKNTLVVMIGFIFLMLGDGFGIFGNLLYLLPIQSPYQHLSMSVAFELAGYIAFLVALLRLKGFR